MQLGHTIPGADIIAQVLENSVQQRATEPGWNGLFQVEVAVFCKAALQDRRVFLGKRRYKLPIDLPVMRYSRNDFAAPIKPPSPPAASSRLPPLLA